MGNYAFNALKDKITRMIQMDSLFITILNMSITGAFVIAAICIARIPLKKAPKIISYCLWAVAGFRLVFPFSLESMFSLIPFNAKPIPPDIVIQVVTRIDSDIPIVNNAISSILPTTTQAAGSALMLTRTMISAYVWLAVAIVMLIFGVVSYIHLKYKMRSAVHIEDNIYITNMIMSPFVLGLMKPKIYLPANLDKKEFEYIVMHERTHIKRCDHISKAVAYLVLCLHWFNPFAWVAFLLMNIDMEMSCDERVLKVIGPEVKKDYSLSLLSQTSRRHFFNGSPLAFSEGGLKSRIKNVLNFKKIPKGIVLTAVVLTIVFSAGLALNKASSIQGSENDFPQIDIQQLYENRDDITIHEFMTILERSDLSFNEQQIIEKLLLDKQLAVEINNVLGSSHYIIDSDVIVFSVSTPHEKATASVVPVSKDTNVLSDELVRWIVGTLQDNIPGLLIEDMLITDHNINLPDTVNATSTFRHVYTPIGNDVDENFEINVTSFTRRTSIISSNEAYIYMTLKPVEKDS